MTRPFRDRAAAAAAVACAAAWLGSSSGCAGARRDPVPPPAPAPAVWGEERMPELPAAAAAVEAKAAAARAGRAVEPQAPGEHSPPPESDGSAGGRGPGGAVARPPGEPRRGPGETASPGPRRAPDPPAGARAEDARAGAGRPPEPAPGPDARGREAVLASGSPPANPAAGRDRPAPPPFESPPAAPVAAAQVRGGGAEGGGKGGGPAPRPVPASEGAEAAGAETGKAARKPPPPPGLDYTRDCLSSGCHGALLEKFSWIHGPVSLGACDACHEPAGEPEEHRFQLTRAEKDLCTFCHLPPGPSQSVHKPYAEFTCLGCHDPHGGTTRASLTVDSVPELCGKCHEAPRQTVLHRPVAEGDCLGCHLPHQSPAARLLRREGKALCVSCHEDLEQRIAALSHVHGPAAVDCSACHTGHGGEDSRFLRDDLKGLCLSCHDAFAEKLAKDTHVHGALDTPESCSGCHEPHASDHRWQLRAVAADLCLSCHNREIVDPKTRKRVANIGRQLQGAHFKHGPVATGDCQGCHFSHSGVNTQLLKDPYPPTFYEPFSESAYALCFGCHEKSLVLEERTTALTGFRDGDVNLHTLHVNREKGRTCRACHEVHASRFPKHIRESVPFGSGGWMLPIQFQKTAEGGKCRPGCHKPQSYSQTGGGAPPGSPPVKDSRPAG